MKFREDNIIVICGPSIEDTGANLVRTMSDFVACDYERLCVILLLIGTDVWLNVSFF